MYISGPLLLKDPVHLFRGEEGIWPYSDNCWPEIITCRHAFSSTVAVDRAW